MNSPILSVVLEDTATEGGWEQPRPLGEVPDMPRDLLPPGEFGRWIENIAEAYSAPLCSPAVLCVLALSGLVGSRIAVQPYHESPERFYPNLWGGIVAPPGSMKSPLVSAALSPLRALDARVAEERDRAEARVAAEREAAEVEIAGAKKALRDGESKEVVLRRLEAAHREKDRRARAGGRYLIANDATAEKMAMMMAQSPGGLLLERDELAGWMASMDREGQSGAREFYLETWEGGRSYSQHRVGRGDLRVESATLTVIGGIQPGKLSAYVAEASGTTSVRNDGLLQRFQLIVIPETKRWVFRDGVSPESPAVHKLFANIDGWLPKPKMGELWQPRIARLDECGYECWARWIQWWMDETVVPLYDDSPSLAGHFSKYRSLHLALSLIFAIIDEGGGPVDTVCEPHVRRASGWCQYLAQHAERMYSISSAGSPAERLAQAIRVGRIREGATFRDVCLAKPFGRAFKADSKTVRKAVAELEEAGWVRVADGRIAINPLIERKQA